MEFVLGLQVGGFNRNLASATSGVKSFASTALRMTGLTAALEGSMGALKGMANVVEGVMGAFERGAALEHLSKQTGVAVGSLYQLQAGLKAVGLDSSSAGDLVLKMQRSLGGINAEGLPTAHIFAQLGLNIADLKAMNAPDAIRAIAAQMSHLDNSSATAASAQIFGREGSREFLQLARSTKEFSEGLEGSARAAAVMQRSAGTFATIELSLTKLKDKSKGLFAGIAEGIAPALETILSVLNQIDLVSIGEKIGAYLSAVVEAFREGKLGELVYGSLKVGFEAILDYLPGLFAKIGIKLFEALQVSFVWIQAGLTYAIEHGLKATGLKAFSKTASFGELVDLAKKQTGSQAFVEGVNKYADQSLAQGNADFQKKWESFWKTSVQPFADRAPKPQAGASGGLGGAFDLTGGYKGTFTALEKMGFVNHGASLASDYPKQTAANTRRTNDLLDRLLQRPQLAISNRNIYP